MSDNRYDRTTRRGFLTAAGATGVALGVGSVGATGVEWQTGDAETHYRFGGRISGWQGREPESIADTVNPTIELQAGSEYAITWVNVDGAPHNVAILGQSGDVLAQTEIISGQGESQTLRFTATEEMSSYICQVHPNSMAGDIVVGGGAAEVEQTTPGNQTTTVANQTATTVPGQTTVANQTTTTVPNPTEAEVQETTHPLADQYGEQPVKFIAQLEPPQGVRTEATGTTWFTLHPPNGVVAKLMYSTHVENVENVTGIDIVLTERTNPVVANLFQPRSPVDETNGTLVDEIVRAEALVGPFEGEPLLRLTEAIRNDNARVVVRTTDHPDGELVGTIRGVDESAAEVNAAADETTAAANESAEGDESEAGVSVAGGVDTDDIVSQAQAPGFGGLSALAGIAGAVGYMLKRNGDDD